MACDEQGIAPADCWSQTWKLTLLFGAAEVVLSLVGVHCTRPAAPAPSFPGGVTCQQLPAGSQAAQRAGRLQCWLAGSLAACCLACGARCAAARLPT